MLFFITTSLADEISNGAGDSVSSVGDENERETEDEIRESSQKTSKSGTTNKDKKMRVEIDCY